jgi:hypothetical protein
MAATDSSLPGLLTPSVAYKPFRYPWAYDFWLKQQQVHWMPEEVPLGEDVQGLGGDKMTAEERNLLTQIFRFFTQSDVEVGAELLHGTLHAGCSSRRKCQMMLSSFLQHGDDPHRGLCAAARHHRHAGQRVLRLHGIQGDGRQARLSRPVRHQDE